MVNRLVTQEVKLKFKETQIIKCPSKKSFQEHLKSWPSIIKIGKQNSCTLAWKIKSKKQKTFELSLSGNSKQDQMNALIKVMKFLEAQGIEPAEIIETIDQEKNNKIEQCLVLLEEEGILSF